MSQSKVSQNNISQSKAQSNVRVKVIETLLAIQAGQSLTGLLDPLLNGLQGEDKGFAHALLLTTLRHWFATARLLDSLADNPIEELAVRTSIQVGITQLLYLQVADHAAIHETVEAVKKIDLARATGLVNAILRKVSKNPSKFRKKCDKNHSLPNWLAKQLKQDWAEYYDELTQSLRQPAPIFLRVNHTQANNEQYLQLLAEAELTAQLLNLTTSMTLPSSNIRMTVNPILLQSPTPIWQLPNFAEGMVSVQDAHAQLAAPILHSVLQASLGSTANKQSLNLLDACAAPGGKLAHWLELIESKFAPKFHVKQTDDKVSISITAIDNEPKRNSRIFENLERLQLPTTISTRELGLEILCADATTWQANSNIDSDSKKNTETNTKTKTNVGFDAILLDAPCTATGVIRRHPDIALLRTEADITQTVALQAQILDNLWGQLNEGGYLLYVTCSILKAENVEQMQAFISRHTDTQVIEFDDVGCNWGIKQDIGRQCLSLGLPLVENSGDGFYFALLQKVMTES
ncbi:transcription antitermination factor NusB [Psychrobacter sp. I-STPA10]|uniref:transcription antitermination factor NusB n=1 Tax=Psychrobacter sp. I-STPA10 TaxID=2585769 RepID=UPI001E5A24FA|nr:transcription antitermination factor NusB [Psychrobacter sp. I-STPA10]